MGENYRRAGRKYAERDDNGQFSKEITDDELLEYFVEADEPFQNPGRISSHFGMSRPGMTLRLDDLAEDGALCASSGHLNIYWLPSRVD